MTAALGFLARALGPLRPLRLADVGANPLGGPVYAALLERGLAEVWGFEPHPEAAAALRAQATPGLTVLECAVGQPGEAVFHAYRASEMSSIYPLSASAIGYLGHFRRHLGTETAMPVTLQALDQIADLPDLDVLKVDAQGAELAVLQGGRHKLRDAVAVVAEMRFYKLYDGEPMLHALDAELRAQGFVLHRFLHQKSRMLGNSQAGRLNKRAIGSQLIDGDAVYIRDLEDRAAVSDTQLAHLALLANAVFGSHDLVLWCLDTLAARGAIATLTAERYVDKLPAALRASQG